MLVARADDRRLVFLVLTRGDELVLRARMVDRPAADEPLTAVDLREVRRLGGGRVGYVFDDHEDGYSRRYLLVCEQRSERCVARVPLRVLGDVELERYEDRVELASVPVSEVAFEIQGDVVRLRLLSGHWGTLFEHEAAPEIEGDTLEMELPPIDQMRWRW